MKTLLTFLVVFFFVTLTLKLQADESLVWDNGISHEGQTVLSASNHGGERANY